MTNKKQYLTELTVNSESDLPNIKYEKGLRTFTSDTKKHFYYDTSSNTWVEEAGSGGGGSVTISATSYASNTDAVAALGVGVLYKSTTLINGSPIILLTV